MVVVHHKVRRTRHFYKLEDARAVFPDEGFLQTVDSVCERSESLHVDVFSAAKVSRFLARCHLAIHNYLLSLVGSFNNSEMVVNY